MNFYIPILIFIILGMMTYYSVRHYYPWKPKHQMFFWISTFGPMILAYSLNLSDMIEYTVLAFFGGAIIADSTRPKMEALYKKIKTKMEGDTTLYVDPKKKKRSTSSKRRQGERSQSSDRTKKQ